MKPQDVKKTSPGSSQAQGANPTDETLEELLARLEQTAVTTQEMGKPSPGELQAVIAILEDDIATGRCVESCYTDMDRRIMPTLVEQANHRHKGANIKFAPTPQELPSLIKATINSGARSARYIVNVGEDGFHCAVIDHRNLGGVESLIMLEPTTSHERGASLLGLRVKQAIESAELPPCSFSIAEMDSQQNPSESGILSIAFAKKLHTESRALERMHKDHVRGSLSKPDFLFIPPSTVDKYLPVGFYKHVGSAVRLRKFLKENPAEMHKSVNKKGEELFERYNKFLFLTEEKAFSLSPYVKRKQEYKSALEQSLSQTQEGASASGGLEQAAAGPERSLPFSREELKNIIASLERDLDDGSWPRGKHHYADMDSRLMPALIDKANQKYPELNLKFITTSDELVSSVKEAIAKGAESSRYIVGTKDRGIHFSVIDHRNVGGQASLIAFDPSTLGHDVSALLAMRIQIAVHEKLPECFFSKVEMDIQRSPYECGILCLALAKKLHTGAHSVTKMHEDNVNGLLCKPEEALSHEKLDSCLPADFYKHAQSRRRLDKYLKSNPEAAKQVVNKKGETLEERFKKNLAEVDGRAVSTSPHRKRIREYKSLMM